MSNQQQQQQQNDSTEESESPGFFKRWRKGANGNTPTRPLPGSIKAVTYSTSPTGKISTSNIKDGLSNMNLGEANNGDDSPKKAPEKRTYHTNKIESLLNVENVDLMALRQVTWNGVPMEHRPMVWQLLLGYLPTNRSRREAAIAKKRKEYFDCIPTYFDISEDERTIQEGETLRQILVDLPRTFPDNPFFHQKPIQRAMERILYIWSIRHPASGYVQGMNDLLTPLLVVFMHPHVQDVQSCDLGAIDPKIIENIEADSYWCFSKLLDNIQDHYTFSQPGLQRMVLRLEDLVRRIDADLDGHFQQESLQYMQFAFRWMNCLLLRELPLRCIIRLWDTYISEERGGFENFHVYVCAVLLKIFKDKLMEMQFQDILMYLQDFPTSSWGEEEVEPILSQAYILSTLFENSPSHLK